MATTLVVEDAEQKKAATKNNARKGAGKSVSKSRRKSREIAMKAVYRGMLNASEPSSDLSTVLRDMTEDPDYNKSDEVYFKHLLNIISEHTVALDEKLAQFIDRKVSELSPIEHAILRISGGELMFDLSIPYRVVINEGVELAKIYGGIDGHKYINGVLDKMAANVRAAEVEQYKA